MPKWFKPVVLALLVHGCGTVTPPPPPGCVASTCAGCCDGAGVCQDGTATSACGRLGLVCAACLPGQTCVAGLCQGTAIGGGTAGGGSAGGGAAGGGTSGGSTGGGASAGGTAGGGIATAGGTAGGAQGGGFAGGSTAGGTAGANGGGSVAGGTAMGGGAATRSTRFQATPLRFSVPASVYNAPTAVASGAGVPRLWDTLDLNGDGRVDLAITSNPATGAVFVTNSVSHWNVHLGTPTGFSGSITQWVVPSNLLVAQGYNATRSESGLLFWATTDVTGDGRPDLVHTMNPTSGGPYVSLAGAMTDGWLLRRGGANSFDQAAVTWTVPRVTNLSGGIDRVANDTVGRRWTLAEVTGDALVDLIITADPVTDNVWLTNGTQWVVCAGTVSGYPPVASCPRYTVPDNGVAGGFKSANVNAPASQRVWALIDMNGDGRMDLVQTLNPAVPGASTFLNFGTPAWRVWFSRDTSSGSLFDIAPTLWTVPAVTFFAPSSAAGLNYWQTMDLDGDRLPELVQTADPATGRPFGFGTAAPSWRVYAPARGGGFQTTTTSWTIPAGPAPDGFRSTTGTGWAVMDITGDARPDLVQFQDPATGLAFTDVSGSFWRVYPGIP